MNPSGSAPVFPAAAAAAVFVGQAPTVRYLPHTKYWTDPVRDQLVHIAEHLAAKEPEMGAVDQFEIKGYRCLYPPSRIKEPGR